jgi:cysteine desulfurase/selenocysteine lyase
MGKVCEGMKIPKIAKFRRHSIGMNRFDLNWNVEKIRSDFSVIKNRYVNNYPVIWFDNGATTQKPTEVIKYIEEYYNEDNSNVHRGAHELAKISTDKYEYTRNIVHKFINSRYKEEIIFVRGTTEGINLLMNSFAKKLMSFGGTILLSMMEHHANIVPWQLLCNNNMNCKIDYIPILENGDLDLNYLENRMKQGDVKLVSVTHVSNVLGTMNDIKKICSIVHKYNSYVIIDGAQGISNTRVDMIDIDTDFYVFSGHKLFGPTGVGVVYGKKELLNNMDVWQGGGQMIKDVTLTGSTFQDIPYKFEAGTGSLASVIGLGKTIDYLMKLDWEEMNKYKNMLKTHMLNRMVEIENIDILGNSDKRTPIFSFVIKNIDMHELGNYLNKYGIAIRIGHHCAQPIVRHYGYESTMRASLTFYNTISEINIFIDAIKNFIKNKK